MILLGHAGDTLRISYDWMSPPLRSWSVAAHQRRTTTVGCASHPWKNERTGRIQEKIFLIPRDFSASIQRTLDEFYYYYYDDDEGYNMSFYFQLSQLLMYDVALI
jgi:hypothetical protein